MRQIAPAHTFFDIDAFVVADAGLFEATPSIEVLRFVLGDELFQFGRLPEEPVFSFSFLLC